MSIRFTNFPQFERQIKKFAKHMRINANVFVRKIAFDVFAGVTKRTPVDTGWARSNWQIAIGNPSTNILEKPPENSNGEAYAKSVNAKQLRNLTPSSIEAFPVIWITNNLPYIIPLEYGHSKQMDKGYMVQRTLSHINSEIIKQLGEI